MALIRLLADKEDDTLPPPPPMLRGGEFPVDGLLLELQQQRQRARRREAAFLSIIGHLCLLLLLLLSPKIFKPLTVQLVSPQKQIEQHQLTYLELPPDLITRTKPTQPKALSNRDRHFEHQNKILSSISVPHAQPAPKPRPAEPPPGPVHPTPPAPAPPAAAAPQPQPAEAPKPSPKTGGSSGLELHDLSQPKIKPTLKFNISPTDQLQRAIEGAVAAGAHGGQRITETAPLPQAPSGSGSSAPGQTGAGVQILTDTQGVDFDSYLRRVVEIVRRNWYAVMPETVYLGTQGRVVIIFNINSNGTVPGIHPTSLSGTQSLDQAAEASITASNPFPPLPTAFHGPFITLQFSFYYNLTPQQP